MKKLANTAFFVIMVAILTLVTIAISPVATGYTAGSQPSEIAEVAAELHPPNEVTRELHPDMFKSPDTVGIYGSSPRNSVRSSR